MRTTVACGPCDCESDKCEEPTLRHAAGNCKGEPLILIEVFGHKQQLCPDCFSVTCVLPKLDYKLLRDLRR